ncbi:MAG: MFS transporter [Acidimicrobiales bacterium]
MPDQVDERRAKGGVQPADAPGIFAALRYRNFRVIWLSAIVSNAGRFFQAVAVPLVLYELTDSAGWVGLAGFAQLLPTALLGPLAGAIADRYQRRNILIVTQALQAVASVLFVVMWFGGVRSPTAYVLASIVAGAAAGLNLPAWQAFVSELVPRHTLMSAITLNSAQFNLARLLGPLGAGVVIRYWGPGWAFLVNALSFATIIAALVMVTVPHAERDRSQRMRPWREFVAAFRFSRTRPGIITAIGTVTFVGFFGLASQTMSVALAEEVFEVEAGFAQMLFAAGLGAVIASPGVAWLAKHKRRSVIQQWALLLYGLGIVLAGAAPTFLVAQSGLFLMGVAHIASASTLNTSIQLQVDEAVRAKVLSVYLTTLLIANPLGQLALGQSIVHVGARETFIVSGLALVLVAVVMTATGRLIGLDDEVGDYEPSSMAEVHPTTPAPPR